MLTVKIYAIVNPKDDEVLYVGASLNPKKRYAMHSVAGEWHFTTRRYKIVKALAKERILPKLVILEECAREDGRARENHYINLYKSLGHKLQQQKSGYNPIPKKSMKEMQEEYRRQEILKKEREDRIKNIPLIAAKFMNSIEGNPVLERNQPEK